MMGLLLLLHTVKEYMFPMKKELRLGTLHWLN